MILISHRGNINGLNKSRENHPDYIKEALDAGYDVEVDVWYSSGGLYLGHDAPQYKIRDEFLWHDNLWCHAKNFLALEYMRSHPYADYHYFWHQNDRYTLTSHNWIWTFLQVLEVNSKCIIGRPEIYPDDFDFSKVGGIWSDNIQDYQKYK